MNVWMEICIDFDQFNHGYPITNHHRASEADA